jgi:mRNA interferase RelE/StbE
VLWRVSYKKTAVHDLKKLSPQIRARIKAKLEFFYAQVNPLNFAQPLTKPADAHYRWRVGNYRILFDVDHDLIIILRVQHRKEVYR